MSIGYAWEKLHVGVLILASGNDSVQERLGRAYANSIMRLTPEDLPEAIREKFEQLEEEMTSVAPSGDEGRIAATTQAMSEEAASALAEQIVSMYDAVTRRMPQLDD
jgi:hypothetical protein